MFGWVLVILFVVAIFSAHKLPALKEELKSLADKSIEVAKSSKEKAEKRIEQAKKNRKKED